MIDSLMFLNFRQIPPRYLCMNKKEQAACYRFLKSLLREHEEKLHNYETCGLEITDARTVGEIAYLKNVISGLKLAIYRTGYKPLEESNGI